MQTSAGLQHTQSTSDAFNASAATTLGDSSSSPLTQPYTRSRSSTVPGISSCGRSSASTTAAAVPPSATAASAPTASSPAASDHSPTTTTDNNKTNTSDGVSGGDGGSPLEGSTGTRERRVRKVVEVDLGDRSYPIFIGPKLLQEAKSWRAFIPSSKVLIVTDDIVAPLYLDKCIESLKAADDNLHVEALVLPQGEASKNLDVLSTVWDKALECKLERSTTFVALGGGVIGDMAGFAAACYLRGVPFIQIPTTVMAQVDSSVGGKTGVNHPLGKNMIGAFYQPQCVVIDTETLNTLPKRELASGISEIVKYGLIRDPDLFTWLEANMERLLNRDPEAIAYAVEQSCINKAQVVAEDEREGGVRASLNLGHTFGHAIETGLGYGEWLHGEAVACGMCMAADMSVRLGWIDSEILQRTRSLLQRADLPTAPPESMSSEQFKSLMALDKKVISGKLRLVLLKGDLGQCIITSQFNMQTLDETLQAFCLS